MYYNNTPSDGGNSPHGLCVDPVCRATKLTSQAANRGGSEGGILMAAVVIPPPRATGGMRNDWPRAWIEASIAPAVPALDTMEQRVGTTGIDVESGYHQPPIRRILVRSS